MSSTAAAAFPEATYDVKAFSRAISAEFSCSQFESDAIAAWLGKETAVITAPKISSLLTAFADAAVSEPLDARNAAGLSLARCRSEIVVPRRLCTQPWLSLAVHSTSEAENILLARSARACFTLWLSFDMQCLVVSYVPRLRPGTVTHDFLLFRSGRWVAAVSAASGAPVDRASLVAAARAAPPAGGVSTLAAWVEVHCGKFLGGPTSFNDRAEVERLLGEGAARRDAVEAVVLEAAARAAERHAVERKVPTTAARVAAVSTTSAKAAPSSAHVGAVSSRGGAAMVVRRKISTEKGRLKPAGYHDAEEEEEGALSQDDPRPPPPPAAAASWGGGGFGGQLASGIGSMVASGFRMLTGGAAGPIKEAATSKLSSSASKKEEIASQSVCLPAVSAAVAARGPSVFAPSSALASPPGAVPPAHTVSPPPPQSTAPAAPPNAATTAASTAPAAPTLHLHSSQVTPPPEDEASLVNAMAAAGVLPPVASPAAVSARSRAVSLADKHSKMVSKSSANADSPAARGPPIGSSPSPVSLFAPPPSTGAARASSEAPGIRFRANIDDDAAPPSSTPFNISLVQTLVHVEPMSQSRRRDDRSYVRGVADGGAPVLSPAHLPTLAGSLSLDSGSLASKGLKISGPNGLLRSSRVAASIHGAEPSASRSLIADEAKESATAEARAPSASVVAAVDDGFLLVAALDGAHPYSFPPTSSGEVGAVGAPFVPADAPQSQRDEDGETDLVTTTAGIRFRQLISLSSIGGGEEVSKFLPSVPGDSSSVASAAVPNTSAASQLRGGYVMLSTSVADEAAALAQAGEYDVERALQSGMRAAVHSAAGIQAMQELQVAVDAAAAGAAFQQESADSSEGFATAGGDETVTSAALAAAMADAESELMAAQAAHVQELSPAYASSLPSGAEEHATSSASYTGFELTAASGAGYSDLNTASVDEGRQLGSQDHYSSHVGGAEPATEVAEGVSAAYMRAVVGGAEPEGGSAAYAQALPQSGVAEEDGEQQRSRSYSAALPGASPDDGAAPTAALTLPPARYATGIPGAATDYASALPVDSAADLFDIPLESSAEVAVAAPAVEGIAPLAAPPALPSSAAPAPARKGRIVHCIAPPPAAEEATRLSVYAPLSAAPTAVFRVSVYMFAPRDERAVRDVAASGGNVTRGTGLRDLRVKRGALVSVMLYLNRAAFELAGEPVLGALKNASGPAPIEPVVMRPQRLRYISDALKRGHRIGMGRLSRLVPPAPPLQSPRGGGLHAAASLDSGAAAPLSSAATAAAAAGVSFSRQQSSPDSSADPLQPGARPDAVTHFAWTGAPETAVFYVRARADAACQTYPCHVRALSGDRSVTFKFLLAVEPLEKVRSRLASTAATAARVQRDGGLVSSQTVSRTWEMGVRGMAPDSADPDAGAVGIVRGVGAARVEDSAEGCSAPLDDVLIADDDGRLEVLEEVASAASMQLLPAALGDWQVQLARGGHGEVLLSSLRQGNRVLVLKRPIIDPHAASDAVVRAFKHEAAVQASLGRHPNLVRPVGVFDGADGQAPFVALEYLPLGSLRAALDRAAGLSAAGDDDAVATDASSDGRVWARSSRRVWDVANSAVAGHLRRHNAAGSQQPLRTSDGSEDLGDYLRRAQALLDQNAGSAASPLSLRSAVAKLQIGRDAAAGLAVLHSAGFIHRDVAARNVLLSLEESDADVVALGGGGGGGGRFVRAGLGGKLCDVGLAVRLGLAPPSAVADEQCAVPYPGGASAAAAADDRCVELDGYGTPGWMAPESLRYSVVSQATDMYMFGALLYELWDAQGREPWAELRGDRGRIFRALRDDAAAAASAGAAAPHAGRCGLLRNDRFSSGGGDGSGEAAPPEVPALISQCLDYRHVFADLGDEGGDEGNEGNPKDLLRYGSHVACGRPSSSHACQRLEQALMTSPGFS